MGDADGGGHTLAQGAGAHIHASRAVTVGMAGKPGSVGIDGQQLLDREVAFQRQRGVQGGAGVPLGHDKVVPILPLRVLRIHAHYAAIEYTQHICGRHGAAQMAEAQFAQGLQHLDADVFCKQLQVLMLCHRTLPHFLLCLKALQRFTYDDDLYKSPSL